MGPVRLRHLEHSSFRGQAQVNVDGQWGVMCDRDYTDQEAQVVCRELQCEGGMIQLVPVLSIAMPLANNWLT